MKPLLLKYFFVPICILMGLNSMGQDIHFSQIFETPLLRNPALAGLFSGDVRVQAVYRNQWNSFTNAYNTVSANAEFKLGLGESDDFITLGGQALYDKAGDADLTSTHLLPALNYHKALSVEKNRYLSLAIMGGYVQRSIDRSKVTTNSQFNGSSFDPAMANGESFTNSNYGYIDGIVGMSYNSQIGENTDNNMYLGVAYHHFTRPKKLSFYSDADIEMKPKMVVSAGLRTNVSDYSYMTFEGDYSTQSPNKESIAGLMYSMKLDDPDNPKYLIHAGSYVRFGDAVIPVVKVENKPIAIAVSYDVNISGLKRASMGRGGFEISLTYQKFLDRDNSSLNKTRCPKF